MGNLKELVKKIHTENKILPFGIISASKEQKIFSWPVTKPSLAVVLEGEKQITVKGGDAIDISSGKFLFVSNNTTFDMRHKPFGSSYLALLIEFEIEDFNDFNKIDKDENIAPSARERIKYITGEVNQLIEETLMQFVEFSTYSPDSLWSFRRKEIIHCLYESGFKDVKNIAYADILSYRINKFVSQDVSADATVDDICSHLLMTKSTLRRKLKAEGTNINEIKRRARLNHSLVLIQTTAKPIGKVAEMCGFSSQSRFAEIFKNQFGITPRELRRARFDE